MNQKKRTSSHTAILISVIAVMLLAALGLGYQIGKNRSDLPPVVVSPEPAARSGQTPLAEGLTPEQLAVAKQLPVALSDPAGDYKLVAVVEGAEANRKLTSSLQVIGSQRQHLLSLSRQYDQTPATSLQQRELIAGEILKARSTLAQNLGFMAKNYGYSLNFNYRLVPHAASLLLVSAAGDTPSSLTLVHQFKDATSYERFQRLRDEFLLLSLKQSSGQPTTPTTPDPSEAATPEEKGEIRTSVTEASSSTDPQSPKTDDSGSSPAVPTGAPATSSDLLALKETLIEQFAYDPSKNHQLNFEKTALYARPGQP